MTSSTTPLTLTDFSYPELFSSTGLERLDQTFLNHLQAKAHHLHEKLLCYRNASSSISSIEISELLIDSAKILEDFLGTFFNIEEPLAKAQATTTLHNPIAAFKKYYVLKRAKKEIQKANNLPSFETLDTWLTQELQKAPIQSQQKELAIALLGMHFLNNPETFHNEIEKLVAWCTQALASKEGQKRVKAWTSFQLPERIDHQQLVPTVLHQHDQYQRLTAPASTWRERDGFKLTDPRMNADQIQNEVNYCIYCHDHEGDFCSKGFPVKKGDPLQGLKQNPLGLTLTGCPLEEKISEMQLLKRDGFTLASLAMVMIDNPMCPATGHRICNDCMKACIYQKQDPVNIPQIETRVLTDVLDLPWGVEIYDLLTRWNPLRPQQWVMKPYNGLKVMIAGMGPAGFTLAHHLLLEGFAVVGFDGLKIEPLPQELLQTPIYRFADLKEALDERIMTGFGGVAEYGITSRWDKNFLKLIYLSLLRKPYFQVFGGVRFGGTVTVEDAFEMGFDHFVVAVGAGLPKALPIPGSLAPGMRQANDFLMSLQLGNAAKQSSLTNLQIRLPAVVIGGGLTGVDTATELQAYYIAQVEKISTRYELLVKQYGEDATHQQFDAPSLEILSEYIRHGKAVKEERKRAKQENRQPRLIQLIHEWGGVTIAYRKSMQESPAYINNHEELAKALQEGVFYLEGLEPIAAQLNEYGHTETLLCHRRIRNEQGEWIATTEEVSLPARSILVATGTQPNIAYEFEHRGTFNRLNLQYQHYEDSDGELSVAHGVKHCKDPQFGPFTSYHKQDHRVSLIGDTHPVFHGSVVKAIASGLRTYPKILNILKHRLNQKGDEAAYQQFKSHMADLFSAIVTDVTRKTKNIIELTIKAPIAVKHFKPGQFYRLQNYESDAVKIDHTLFQMEPLSLTTAGYDKKNNLLHFIVQEKSASAKLCATFKKGDRVVLMGPTGVRAKIPGEHETVLVIGNQSSFPFLRCYGKTLRELGNHVIYIGLFESKEEVYCQRELENAADAIVFASESDDITPTRTQDSAIKSNNIFDILETYLHHNAGFLLADVDRIYLIGDTTLLKNFQTSRQAIIKKYFLKDPKIFASVYGNMQCMLKGVCAQCLQWQIDPETGERTKAVFACSWQDQPLEIIDIDHMEERQMHNRVHDQINRLWVDYLFEQYHVERC